MLRRLLVLSVAAAVLSLVAPYAHTAPRDKVIVKDKNDKTDKKDDDDKKRKADAKKLDDKDKERAAKHKAVVFEDRHRSAVRSYYHGRYGRGNCPPGLAKKGNGCLPPGIAKKRYILGEPLGYGVVYKPVPRTLMMRLGPAPYGYEYIMVDGDVLKRAIATKIVVDAIDYYID